MKRMKRWLPCLLCVSILCSLFLGSQPTVYADSEFETELSKFPDSYHEKLRALHKKHPNWKFQAVSVPVNWDNALEHESNLGVNTIASNVPKGGSASSYSAPFSFLSKEGRAYNVYQDSFRLIDGSNMYTASKQVVAHYMDPRNFLTEQGIFQFEALNYNETHTQEGVEQILGNTFMKGNYSYRTGKAKNKKKITKNYAETFMEAGRTNNINPYFLAAKCKNEVGVKGSGSTSGKYPGYKGYYNFFNIGAGDSSSGQAIAKGLRFAKKKGSYQRPWNTPYKSISGGASYIAKEYVAVGQNTLYLQKFSVMNSAYRYWHQYSTNVQSASSQASSVYQAYKAQGILNKEILFCIPVYRSMPASPCALPKRTGSDNAYIKHLIVSHGKKKLSLLTSLNYRTKNFHLTVENDISTIRVKGETCNKKAKLSGRGTYHLAAGKTRVISLKCKAQDGTTRDYRIKVTRLPK